MFASSIKKTSLFICVLCVSILSYVAAAPLSYDIEVDIKDIESFYVNDGAIFKYNIYYHNNGSQSINDVVLSTNSMFMNTSLLNIIHASLPGNILSETIYGLPGDVCLPDLHNSTGHYMTALDQWAFAASQGSFPDFVALLENFLTHDESTGEPIDVDPETLAYLQENPGLFLLEYMIPEVGSLQNFFLEIGIIDMQIIDPSCGTAQTIGSDRNIGTIAPNFGGYITVYAQLLKNTSSTIEDKGTSTDDATVLSSDNIDKRNGTIFRTFTNTSDGTTSLFFNQSGAPLLFSNQTILDSLVDESMSEQEKAVAIWQFVKDHTFNYPNLAEDNHWYRDSRWMDEANEKDPVHILNTLYGMCGEINGAFASLASMAGLQARVTSHGAHIATEVLIDNQDGNGPQRAFMDADGGSYWTDGSGRIYSLADLEQDPSIVYDNLGDYPESYADTVTSAIDNQTDETMQWSNSDHTMLLTLGSEDTINYGYYDQVFNDDVDDVLYAEGTVTRAVLHDSMLSGISANEFSFMEYIPYLPIAFELSTDMPLQDDVYVYLKEQYTDSEVALGRFHNRLVYNLNETPHAWENAEKHNYNYTLRFVCPSGCNVEELTANIQLETSFTFNHLALPYDSDLDLYIESFSGSSAAIQASTEYDTNEKVFFSATISGNLSDEIEGNNTKTVSFNTLNHNYAILPLTGGLLSDVLEYKGYIYNSNTSLFEENAFVGRTTLDLHNTLTIQDNIIMTDEDVSIQALLHSGLVITPSGNNCGNEFLLAPEDTTDLSGDVDMTFVVGSSCNGRTLSFSEPVRIRVSLANEEGSTIVAQISHDNTTRSPIDAIRIDDNTIELLAPHFSYFQVQVSNNEETSGSTSSIGGGGSSLQQDVCPDEDTSGSYYDGKCGEVTSVSGALVHSSDAIAINDTCTISDEIMDAYKVAFDLGITTVADPCAADLYGPLLRKHLAKFLTMYAVTVLDMKPDMNRTCSFSDMGNQSAETKLFAKTACQLGLMGLEQDGTPDSIFNPNQVVTRAQFGTTFSRLIYGNTHNIDISSPQPWYQDHLAALFTNNIMKDITNPSMQEVRGFVLLMMSRAKDLME